MKMNDSARKLSYLKKTQKPEKNRISNVNKLTGWNKVSKYVYSKIVEIDAGMFIEKINNEKLTVTNSKYCLNDMIFFDTETTGLSSGAGNYIFLLGIINIKNNKITCEQIFLGDFPGEYDFINYISGILPTEKLYVSYNGKGFDYHALKNRFILHNRELTIINQLDLLYISRRLWKNIIGSCSLTNIEEKVLGIKREEDIPGYEIPDVYFNFLRTGSTEKINKVFDHNYNDILTLVRLLLHIEMIINNKTSDCIDNFGLGVYLEKNKHAGAVKQILNSFNNGNMKAGIHLANYYKRNTDWENAIRILKKLKHKNVDYAFIELSKYYEHKAKDPETALKYMLELVNIRKKKNMLLRICTAENMIKKTIEIDKRIKRLENKIKKIDLKFS